LRIDILQSGQDAFDEKLNPRMLPCTAQPRLDRCGYSAAIRVAKHDEEQRLQMPPRILQTPRDFQREHISCDADNEQLAESGVEDQLGRHARIAATQDGGIGMLPLGKISENFLLHRWKSRRPGDKSRVPCFQALQGVLGTPSGIGNHAHAGGLVATAHPRLPYRPRPQPSRIAALPRFRTTG
jgi:hypothetical protein